MGKPTVELDPALGPSGLRFRAVTMPLPRKHMPDLPGPDPPNTVLSFPFAFALFHPKKGKLRQHPAVPPVKLIQIRMPRRRIFHPGRNHRTPCSGQIQGTVENRVVNRKVADKTFR